MSATDTRAKDCRHLIGGQWVDSAGAASSTTSTRTRATWSRRSRPADARTPRRAIAAAHEAFATWSQAGPGQRQAIFLKAADILESRRDEVVEWLAKETGCSFGFGMFQMGFVARPLPPGGGRSPTRRSARSSRPTMPGAFAMGVRRPVGVVGAISPWNAALILSARAIAARSSFGNTVVLKPSEESPYVGGLLWGEIFAEAGLPDGVLNIVTHDRAGAQGIGDELVENPRVRRINFTGSTATGRKLAEAAGRNLKRVVLELGGQNPLIVLADADLDYAVDAAAFGAYLHQGQICMSARRIIVERPIAEEFTSRACREGRGPGRRRPARAHHHHRPADQRGRARDGQPAGGRGRGGRGARCSPAASAEGTCYRATLLADVPRDSEFAQVETFGPVAVDRGRRRAPTRRSTPPTRPATGSPSGIITTDPDKGLAHRRSGSRRASCTSTTSPCTTSRRCRSAASRTAAGAASAGTFAMDEFTELQWVTVQSGTRPFPF